MLKTLKEKVQEAEINHEDPTTIVLKASKRKYVQQLGGRVCVGESGQYVQQWGGRGRVCGGEWTVCTTIEWQDVCGGE